MGVDARIVSEPLHRRKIRNVTNSHFSAGTAGAATASYPVLVAETSRTPAPGTPPRPRTVPATDRLPHPRAPGRPPPPRTVPPPARLPRAEPLDPPMVPFAVAGLATFAVTGLVLLLFRGRLAEHGHTNWLWICLAGFLCGLPGLATM